MNYKEWITKWLALYVKPTAKMQTYEKYESIARVHIAPNLGDYRFDQLNAETLQKFVAGLTRNHAANTVNGVVTVLRKSLKTAQDLGITQSHSADKIKRPKPSEKQVDCFTAVQQRKIERAAFASGNGRSLGIILCLYTGLRIGELLALKWTDIDLKKGVITVSRSCHWGRDESGEYAQIIDAPKTAQSVRIIPIPRQLLPHIRGLNAKSDSEFVVSNKGKPVPKRSYQRSFELLLKKLNIPRKGFHSLRHTFATRALECGMDVKTLSEILGHKNPNVTLNRYAHSLIEHKREVMNKLGKYCGL